VPRYKIKPTIQTGRHAGKKLSQSFAAIKLGVSRGHLNRVLHGDRASRRLLAAYEDLKEKFQAGQIVIKTNGGAR
jgi:hypothetical protein